MAISESKWNADKETLNEAVSDLQELAERFHETSWEYHVLKSSIDKIESVALDCSSEPDSNNNSNV